MIVRSNTDRVDVLCRYAPGEIRGAATSWARESDVFYVRPVIRLFGRTVWRGEERVGFEVVRRWLGEAA